MDPVRMFITAKYYAIAFILGAVAFWVPEFAAQILLQWAQLPLTMSPWRFPTNEIVILGVVVPVSLLTFYSLLRSWKNARPWFLLLAFLLGIWMIAPVASLVQLDFLGKSKGQAPNWNLVRAFTYSSTLTFQSWP